MLKISVHVFIDLNRVVLPGQSKLMYSNSFLHLFNIDFPPKVLSEMTEPKLQQEQTHHCKAIQMTK